MIQENLSVLIKSGIIPILGHNNDIYSRIEKVGNKIASSVAKDVDCEVFVILSQSRNSFSLNVGSEYYVFLSEGLLELIAIETTKLVNDSMFRQLLLQETKLCIEAVDKINVVGHSVEKRFCSKFSPLFYDIFEAAVDFILFHEITHIREKNRREPQSKNTLEYQDVVDLFERMDLCEKGNLGAERWEEYTTDRDAGCYFAQSFLKKIFGQYGSQIPMLQMNLHMILSFSGLYLSLISTSRFSADQTDNEFGYNHPPYEVRHYGVYQGVSTVFQDTFREMVMPFYTVLIKMKSVVELEMTGREIVHNYGGIFRL